jgi:hypothetical protein
MNFEKTMTEADFKRPLLDANEEKVMRELRGGEADLNVEGLRGSLFANLVALFTGR